MATKNYLYGCRSPSVDLRPTFAAANRYRNRLVELELSRREQTRQAARAASPAWAAAADECKRIDAEIESAIAARKMTHQREHALKSLTAGRTELAIAARGTLSKLPAVQPADDRLGELRDLLSSARAVEKPQRGPAYAAAKVACDAIEQATYQAIRDARATCGLYWGTYLLVEQAAEEFRRGAPPRFSRFTGEGRIGVQLQGGLSAEEFIGGNDTRLRLMPSATSSNPKHRDLWLRIGSDGRAPVWAVVPIVWHRDLPEGARIKWAIVQCKFVGERPKWTVLLTIDIPTPAVGHGSADNESSPRGCCGIDINYRYTPERGQRVATAVGDDGATHVLTLPPGMVAEWQKCRDIRSIRDTLFDTAKAALLTWLQSNDRPTWMPDTIHAWRSSRRLSAMVFDWHRYRPPVEGEDSILPTLLEWRQREEHLHQYESHLRDQLLRRRKDIYRNWVAMLRKRYETAKIEAMDLRETIHDVLAPEEDQEVASAQRAAAAFVCLSELRQILAVSGIAVVAVSAAGTTETCHACGAVCAVPPSRVSVACQCGKTWDRDANAARNILASGDVATAKKPKKTVTRAQRNQAAREKRSKAAPAKKLG